jgi:hypothetical protein
MSYVTAFLARQAKPVSYAAGALGVLGMVGYVGGRMIAPMDPWLVNLVYLSTYVVLTGLALFGLVLVAVSSIARRPFVLRTLAAILVVFGLLMVLFPYSRPIALPEGVLAAAAILVLVVGWKDLSDPKLWASMPQQLN